MNNVFCNAQARPPMLNICLVIIRRSLLIDGSRQTRSYDLGDGLFVRFSVVFTDQFVDIFK